jgi:hypothetical protein
LVRSFVETGAAIAEAFGASFETATGAATIFPVELEFIDFEPL